MQRERDTLLDYGSKLYKNNESLRDAIEFLEAERDTLINKVLKLNQDQEALILSQADNIEDQREVRGDLENSNDEIITYWKRLARDSHLSANLLTDVENLQRMQIDVHLRIPVVDKFSVNVRPTVFQNRKPVFLLGVEYKIF